MADDSSGIQYEIDLESDDRIVIYGATKESVPLQREKLSNISKQQPVKEDVTQFNESITFYGDDGDEALLTTPAQACPRFWWQHPKVRENWRVVTASFLLATVGLALILTGIIVEAVTHNVLSSIVIFIVGIIAFIPGAYHSIYIYCAVKGRPGYNFYSLPVLR